MPSSPMMAGDVNWHRIDGQKGVKVVVGDFVRHVLGVRADRLGEELVITIEWVDTECR